MSIWGATFFIEVYPESESMYSIVNAFLSICGGLPSSYIGGLLGDYFESDRGGNRLQAKGYLSGLGALTASIFIALCYIVKINFWVSISSLYLAYLTAEVWIGITISMINKTIPSNT